jgi:predicted transcriptional regulator
MTNKELVIRAVQSLPDDASLRAFQEEIALLEAIQRGEAAADAGDLTPHEDFEREVNEWLSK